MTTELISIIANLALTLSLVVAIIFGIAQVRAAARDRRERLTVETLRYFQTREFSEHMVFIVMHPMPQTYEEFKKLSTEDRVLFIQFAQEMESLGLLVAERVINIDLVDKTLGSFVSTAWEKCKPMQTDMRENIPDPFMGEYFQWLAEKISERMRDNPRQPYHERR